MLETLKNLFGSKKKSKTPAPQQDDEWVPQHSVVSPEEMCGINPSSMSKDAIKRQLAILYKRHNDAASSLNPDLREEAKLMLEAIVECRERYIDNLDGH